MFSGYLRSEGLRVQQDRICKCFVGLSQSPDAPIQYPDQKVCGALTAITLSSAGGLLSMASRASLHIYTVQRTTGVTL